MAKEEKTVLTEPTEKTQTNIEEMFATLQKSYDEKLDKLIKAHEEEIKTIKEENKKIIQGIVAGRYNPPAEEIKEDAEDEEYDENDMSIEAQHERTKKELLKRFNFINKKKK